MATEGARLVATAVKRSARSFAPRHAALLERDDQRRRTTPRRWRRRGRRGRVRSDVVGVLVLEHPVLAVAADRLDAADRRDRRSVADFTSTAPADPEQKIDLAARRPACARWRRACTSARLEVAAIPAPEHHARLVEIGLVATREGASDDRARSETRREHGDLAGRHRSPRRYTTWFPGGIARSRRSCRCNRRTPSRAVRPLARARSRSAGHGSGRETSSGSGSRARKPAAERHRLARRGQQIRRGRVTGGRRLGLCGARTSPRDRRASTGRTRSPRSRPGRGGRAARGCHRLPQVGVGERVDEHPLRRDAQLRFRSRSSPVVVSAIDTAAIANAPAMPPTEREQRFPPLPDRHHHDFRDAEVVRSAAQAADRRPCRPAASR